MCNSSLGNLLNCLIDCNIWNITYFSSNLFAKICGLTILRLKSSSCGKISFANDILLLSSSWFWGAHLSWFPIFWLSKACSIGFWSTIFWLPNFALQCFDFRNSVDWNFEPWLASFLVWPFDKFFLSWGQKTIDLLFFAYVYTTFNERIQYNESTKILILMIKKTNKS